MLSLARAAVCAAILLSFGLVQAQAPKKLPIVVQKEIAEMVKTCRAVGGKPISSPELLLVGDLTADGVPDYVIDERAFWCEGAQSLVGQEEMPMSAYVGTPDGQATRAFSSDSFGVKLDKDATPAKLRLAVAGPMCGQRVTAKMARSDYKSCWRPVVWNAKNRKLEFAPVSQVQFIQ